MRPIRIAAKTTAASDINVALVPAIFFSLPEIRNAFKLGKFTLNQVAIKIRFGLRTVRAAACVVKATLQKEPIVGLVHEKLARGLAIVERFGIIGVCRREDDKSHVVAGITATAAIIIVIGGIERMTRS